MIGPEGSSLHRLLKWVGDGRFAGAMNQLGKMKRHVKMKHL